MNAGRKIGSRTGVGALIAGVLLAQAALAAPPVVTEPVSRTIDARGLDLSSPAGAEQAYRRITRTAKSICRGTHRTDKGVANGKQQREHEQRCFEQAVRGALAEVAERTGIDLEEVARSSGSSEASLVAGR